jgi:hypothetical protein
MLMSATCGEILGCLVCCCMMGNEQFDVDTLCEKQQTSCLMLKCCVIFDWWLDVA